MDATGNEPMPNRIPVRFVDDENEASGTGNESGATPDAAEIGRQSSYEDETEVQRRIDRGQEGDSAEDSDDADGRDKAGGPPVNETPEQREDQERYSTNPTNSGHAQEPEAPVKAGPEVAELIATRAELKRVESENNDLRETLTRRQADFENFRKRIEREKSETYNRIVGDVVMKLLPVVDNLRRALDAQPPATEGDSPAQAQFSQGVELIYKQLTDNLSALGLQPIEAVGMAFNPHLHEAVATEEDENSEPDTVIQEFSRGYLLGDRLLRPAAVKVSTK